MKGRPFRSRQTVVESWTIMVRFCANATVGVVPLVHEACSLVVGELVESLFLLV